MQLRPRRTPLHISAVLAGGLGASAAGVLGFGKIADELLEHQSFTLDSRVVGVARAMRSPAADRLFAAITATGEPWALGVVAAAIGRRWLRENRQADAAVYALALGGSTALDGILKIFFRRPRPPLQLRRAHASSYSFPSGHAMTTLATYGTAAYLVSRHGARTGRPAAAAIWAPVLAACALVGWSRVYLEVHYPTDVLGAWAAATIWITTCGIARSFMEPEET